jgi:hypothetical protein
VDVLEMPATERDPSEVDVETPGPLQAKDVGAPPPEHVAVNVTDPPPNGKLPGVAVTRQADGGCGRIVIRKSPVFATHGEDSDGGKIVTFWIRYEPATVGVPLMMPEEASESPGTASGFGH